MHEPREPALEPHDPFLDLQCLPLLQLEVLEPAH